MTCLEKIKQRRQIQYGELTYYAHNVVLLLCSPLHFCTSTRKHTTFSRLEMYGKGNWTFFTKKREVFILGLVHVNKCDAVYAYMSIFL